MITIDVPGRKEYTIENIVFDYNGTIACDGIMSEEVRERLGRLGKLVKVYVLTADTYGTVREQCRGLPVEVTTFPKGKASGFKREFIEKLNNVCAIGNGYNDREMLKVSDLSIVVLDEEGLCSCIIAESDILVRSSVAALDLILKKNRLVATLRA